MARYRKRKRYKRYKKKKGMLDDIALYYKSSARRKGILLGMVGMSILSATTTTGNQVASWIGDQAKNLTGQQG